ncbi:hypothetical protein GQ600_8686 [Phytophthora cactorum]|nr:hypothetical protein GQ600_8686 [Phytophthora cactorum]
MHNNWEMVLLHFVDAEAPEPLEDMLSVMLIGLNSIIFDRHYLQLRDALTPYEANREDVDSMLLTVTVWNMESDSELLPTSGCVVDNIEYSHLHLFRDKHCQLTARLTQIRWSADP